MCVPSFLTRQLCLGPRKGALLAPRGGLGSAPPLPLASAPPPICCLLLFADTRAHVSKCASLPSRPPPRRSHSTLVSIHKPLPPALALSLAFRGLAASLPLFLGPRVLSRLEEGASFLFLPQLRAPFSGLGLDSSAIFPGEGSGCSLEFSATSGAAPRAPGCPVWLLPMESALLCLQPQRLPFVPQVLLCVPRLFLSPPTLFCPPVLCHQILLTFSVL